MDDMFRKTDLFSNIVTEQAKSAVENKLSFRLTCINGLNTFSAYVGVSRLKGSYVRGMVNIPDFENQSVSDIYFSNVHFDCLFLEKMVFSGIDFRGCTFTSSLFLKCTFSCCTFKNCRFFNVEFDNKAGSLLSADEFYSDKNKGFANCQFIGCIFNDVSFSRTPFYITAFLSCDFNENVEFLTPYNDFRDDINPWTSRHMMDGHIYNSKCTGITPKSLADIKSWFPSSVPSSEGFYGWKVANLQFKKVEPGESLILASRKVILKLYIPADAQRVIGTEHDKCRCSKAKLVTIQELSDDQKIIELKEDQVVYSMYDRCFIYPDVGEYFLPDAYDGDIRKTCASGIHFFLSREAAVNYALWN